ncbi:MAG: pseudouridine synthase [Candidatus Zixiibacteriota bacterium]
MIRINKYLSVCGVTSRRGAEKLIADKRITVNDKVIEHPGTVIDEETDVIKVDGIVTSPVKSKYYVLLNKPQNVLTSLSDQFGRKTVAYFTKKVPARVYPVGRLDFDTEGALLLTNDGDLAYRLAHPKYQIKRIYHAIVEGTFTVDDARKIEAGILLEDGHTGHGIARNLSTGIKSSKIEITLYEGHKREIKQLMKAVGHPVISLRRIEFAGLRVDSLRRGRWRFISHTEVRALKDLVGL